MLRAYFGEEDFLVVQAVKRAKENFVEKNPQALVEVFDSGESSVEDFLLSLRQGGGLFVQQKLVILRDVFDFSKNDQEKILNFLKSQFNYSSEVDLIVTWGGKIRANKLLNFLKKQEGAKEFKKISSLEIERFIQNKIKGKAKINSSALKKLSISFSNNLWLLDRELDKLISFRFNEEITAEDVDDLCEGEISVKIFDLVEAVGSQDKKRALGLLDHFLKQGEDGFYILSMMIFQIRNLALVSDCRSKGIFNVKEISSKTGLHPYVSQKTLGQLSRFHPDKIKEIYKRAFLLDINSKSGKIEIKEALKDFIIKI